MGRVDLQQGQLPHDREQLRRPGRVEQLRAHRDAPGLRFGEPVHGQEATSGRRIVAQASERAGAMVASSRSRLAAGHSAFES
jgi:hypothetical protein